LGSDNGDNLAGEGGELGSPLRGPPECTSVGGAGKGGGGEAERKEVSTDQQYQHQSQLTPASGRGGGGPKLSNLSDKKKVTKWTAPMSKKKKVS